MTFLFCDWVVLSVLGLFGFTALLVVLLRLQKAEAEGERLRAQLRETTRHYREQKGND
jgi:hypothetical protein